MLFRSRLQRRRPRFDSWVGNIRWRRNRLPTPVFLGFPCGSDGKESACSVGDLGLVPGLGRSPEEGNGFALQYSGLVNSMDRGAWQTAVHEVAKSRTQLSNFTHSLTAQTIMALFRLRVYRILQVALKKTHKNGGRSKTKTKN